MKKLLILSAALAATAPALAADAAPRAPEATIVFADRNGIDDFRAYDELSIYLRARNGQWYHATMVGFCPGLDKKPSLAYITNPDGTFDRWSTLRVNGRPCAIDSLVESDAPPKDKPAKG